MPQPQYRFVFLVGASGSGTTMFTRILAAPPGCVGLGGNHISIPRRDRAAYAIARRFKQANDGLWDRRASADRAAAAGREMLALIDRLRILPGYEATRHLIFKRSAPFHRGDRYRPDLADLVELFDDLRVLVFYRDPRASTASSYRRRFARNLRACAVITDEQLTYLSAQLSTLGEETHLLVPYEAFCAEPSDWSTSIASFCGLPPQAIESALIDEGVDPSRRDTWRDRLSPDEIAFLDRYFDRRRLAQWPRLAVRD